MRNKFMIVFFMEFLLVQFFTKAAQSIDRIISHLWIFMVYSIIDYLNQATLLLDILYIREFAYTDEKGSLYFFITTCRKGIELQYKLRN